MPVETNPMIAECLRLEEDSQHSAKGHFAASECWSLVHYAVGIPATLLAVAAGHEALSNDATLGGILALLSASFAAILTFLDPAAKKQSHLAAGNHYNVLEKRARIFRTIKFAYFDEPGRQEKFEELCSERERLNLTSPSVPPFAYVAAKKRIEAGQTTYRTDK